MKSTSQKFVVVSRHQGTPRDRDITRIGCGPDFSIDDFYQYAESRGHKPPALQTPVDDEAVINFIANVVSSLPFMFLLSILLIKLLGGTR